MICVWLLVTAQPARHLQRACVKPEPGFASTIEGGARRMLSKDETLRTPPWQS